jgi:hypothetical protein
MDVFDNKFTKRKHCYDSDHRKNCILQSYQSNMRKSIYEQIDSILSKHTES